MNSLGDVSHNVAKQQRYNYSPLVTAYNIYVRQPDFEIDKEIVKDVMNNSI